MAFKEHFYNKDTTTVKDVSEQRVGIPRVVAVLVSNPCTKRKYSALLDMCGLAAELSKYGKMRNVSIAPYVADGTPGGLVFASVA